MADNEKKKPQIDPTRAMSAAHMPAKANVPSTDRPKLDKLTDIDMVSVKPAKEKLGPRIRRAFTNDTAQSVGDYLLFDVAIPAIKRTLFDLIQNGASKTLFGNGGGGVRTPVTGSQINYNQISRAQVQGHQPPSTYSPQASGIGNPYNFNGIVFPTRSAAERALTAMLETIEQYKVFAVSDLYDLVGLPSNWADNKVGWFNLNGADIVPVHNGFILDLPPVLAIQ